MKLKIVLILIISLLTIGCVDNSNIMDNFQNPFNDNDLKASKSSGSNITVQQLEENLKLLNNKCDLSMTSDACSFFVINNKKTYESKVDGYYLTGESTIEDIKNGKIYLSIPFQFSPKISANKMEIELNDVTYNLLELNKNDGILFRGKIELEKNNCNYLSSGLSPCSSLLQFNKISLYDGEITILYKVSDCITTDGSTICTISEPTSSIASPSKTPLPTQKQMIYTEHIVDYYIDTIPPGKGILYINNVQSPNKGELTSGKKYQFELRILGGTTMIWSEIVGVDNFLNVTTTEGKFVRSYDKFEVLIAIKQ
ncbi:MAG: hypothetical protein KKG76_10510 [Euryarchaeota archaeon]|nr:hypothetical protein [Euryarchaeota archaeon]